VDWPTAAVAIGASFASATVAVWALVTQTRNAEHDREHDRTLRRQERRSTAYVELMTALRRLQMGVDRTAPMFVVGVPPEPPAAITDEESWRLSALADVVASDEVRDRIEAWTKTSSEFYNAVWYLRWVQE
jgi:hypothetical protein